MHPRAGQNRDARPPRGEARARRRRGFSLVELLTVIFIISLLIGILIPSLGSARNAAKKLTTLKTIESVKVGLEMFKQDNGSEFPQTNGYPPSFSHPPIHKDFSFQPELGQFPFLPANPVVYGAHWLPAMLMGVDQLGYIKRSLVPNVDDIRKEPFKWYTANALGPGKAITDRGTQLYLDPNGTPTRKTRQLPGRPNMTLFPGWTDNNNLRGMQELPVIVDAFDQPILYYAANTHGRPTNMVGDKHELTNEYTGGIQQEGPPFYFHEDNVGFTGTEEEAGWDFGNAARPHPIARSGARFTRIEIVADANRETFARHVIDRKLFAGLATQRAENVPLRPVNSDTYLLISAGVDGRFGTADDPSNLPPWPQD